MYRFAGSPFVDAYANLVVFESGNLNNYTGWRNKQYDAAASHWLLEPGTPERQKLIDQAQKILLEEAVAVVPIFQYMQTPSSLPRSKGSDERYGHGRLHEDPVRNY